MNSHDRVLLAVCLPWVIAIPISAVVRVTAVADLPLRPGSEQGALLGTIDDNGAMRAAWDLGRLLGTRSSEQAWVLLSTPLPVAIRTGQCLSVVLSPVQCPIPAALSSRPLGLSCFALPSLPLPESIRTGLAPVGLRLDPARLFSEVERIAAHRAIAAADLLHSVGRA